MGEGQGGRHRDGCRGRWWIRRRAKVRLPIGGEQTFMYVYMGRGRAAGKVRMAMEWIKDKKELSKEARVPVKSWCPDPEPRR